ncbi:MAG: multicopper oxidase domain-containing protein [Bauldia sp.]
MTISLDAVSGETEFVSGRRSQTLGFNQSYLGPVVRVRSGTTVHAAVRNSTDRPISVHWHGLLIPGEVDGGPHQPIAPGAVWRPILPIDQPRAMLWYHTHIHGETAERVYAGLAGVLLVDDGEDRNRGLPVNIGVDDLLLVVQDKRLDAGRAVYEPTAGDMLHGFLGDAILVNGLMRPVAAVPIGIVKLRLLNAANARTFDFFFEDGRTFHLVASDQGLLAVPVAVERLRLSPGERAEVLVDFARTGHVSLMSHPHEEGRGASGMGHEMGGMIANEERFTEPFEVIEFRTSEDLPVAVTSVPAAFMVDDDLSVPEPTTTREFLLNDSGDLAMSMSQPAGNLLDNLAAAPPVDHAAHGMPAAAAAAQPGAEPVFGINGRPFDMARIDFAVGSNTTERWIVGGEMMGHPFHVHGARFKVLRDNGGEPRPENLGWKDTVFVDGELELLVQFRDEATSATPFMFHCHVLEHEDRGMMGQFTVGVIAPREYAFELVGEPSKEGAVVRFAVQLVDVGTGTRVTDASIRVVDFNMEPEGMAGGVGVDLLPVLEPGVQPIETIPSMSGRWALVLEATLPGGSTTRGTIIVRVPD